MLEILEFFGGPKKEQEESWPGIPEDPFWGQKENRGMEEDCAFHIQKFFGQEPHSWSKGAINTWFMLLLK